MSHSRRTELESLPEALLVIQDDLVVWANRAAVEMVGQGDLVGSSLESILASGERRRLALLERERRDGWEMPATCRIRFVSGVVTDLRFALGVDGVLVLSARDITDVSRAEELMGKLAQLSVRGVSLPDASALLDATEPVFEELGWIVAFTELVPDGSITRRVIAPIGDPVGDYGRSLLGRFVPYDKTPVLSEVVRRGLPLFLDNIPSMIPETSGATALAESMRKAHLVRSAWCPIVPDGDNTHVLAVTGRNLTEHDFVAVQLFAAQLGAAMQAQRLRSELVHHERLAAVGEMAAVMAHEVRNPLGVIFNAIAGLRHQPSPPTSTELIGIIYEEAERLRRLVTDLLDFSRPSAVEIETVDLEPLLEQAIEAAKVDPTVLARQIPDGVKVVLDVDKPGRTVSTDARLLRRVLVNLLVNAFQHVEPNGAIALTARVGDDQAVELRVENDGPMMTPEVAQRIFEPFFTTRATGTGLGLAVVRRIVEDLGGRISLDRGAPRTRFVIVLPKMLSA